jgi:hypothetical protein
LPIRSLTALLLSSALLAGCSSGVQLGAAVVTTPSHCPEIEIAESGDVQLCHHLLGHWTGAELDQHDNAVFILNRHAITSGGHIVAHYEGDTIVVTLTEGVEDRRLHIDEHGKVVDDAGAVVAIIKPVPSGETEALVFAALIREGIFIPALPPEKAARVSALKVQVIGAGDKDAKHPPPLCECTTGR